jgi:hypothetical protein
MFASMSLLFLYLASILPTMRIAMYFLSSVFIMGLVLEEEIGLAFLMFAAVSLLALLLMPNRLRVVPYVLFFGHYGIGKYYIQTHVRDKVVGYILKLLYYNIAIGLMYLLARQVLFEDLPFDDVAFWLLVVLAEVAFVVYDFVFSKVTSYYFNNIRRLLMKD